MYESLINMSFLVISFLILITFHVADFLSGEDEGWNRTAKTKARRARVDFPHRTRGGEQTKNKRSEAVQITDKRRTKNKTL